MRKTVLSLASGMAIGLMARPASESTIPVIMAAQAACREPRFQ